MDHSPALRVEHRAQQPYSVDTVHGVRRCRYVRWRHQLVHVRLRRRQELLAKVSVSYLYEVKRVTD